MLLSNNPALENSALGNVMGREKTSSLAILDLLIFCSATARLETFGKHSDRSPEKISDNSCG
jgi:hypothetical protein